MKQKDSTTNITTKNSLERKNEEQCADAPTPTSPKRSWSYESPKISIQELIFRIINGQETSGMSYNQVQDIVLLCHNIFTDSQTMLKILLDKICDKEVTDFNIRIRAVRMCQQWMREYWQSDFHGNDAMLDILCTFIDDFADPSSNSKMCHLADVDVKLLTRIKETFNQKWHEFEVNDAKECTQAKPIDTTESHYLFAVFGYIRKEECLLKLNYDVPNGIKYIILKYFFPFTEDYNIVMSESSEFIAQQLTLIDSKIFRNIQRREFCGQAWKKKDRAEKAPNLIALIHQFNKVSKWVQCVVLQQRTKQERTKCIEKVIDIAVHLKDMRNYSGCCAINFGLNANVLYRLKDAWNGVSKKRLKQYEEIRYIYKGKKGWEALRILHKNAHAPAILHCGLFLQDILNTDEGYDNLKDGKVNFARLKQTYNHIERIRMYQQSSYFKIKSNLMMQKYLENEWKRQESYDDDKMFKISTIIKRKDANNEEIDDSDLEIIAW